MFRLLYCTFGHMLADLPPASLNHPGCLLGVVMSGMHVWTWDAHMDSGLHIRALEGMQRLWDAYLGCGMHI